MDKSEIIEEESRLSGSIIDLEKRLASRGIVHSSSKEFIEDISPTYLHVPSEKRKRLKDLIDSPGTGEFPNKEALINGTSFLIHGVHHGEPGLRPTRKVRRHIRNEVAHYHNPPEEEYFFEEGLGKIFGLDESLEIKDFSDLLEEGDGLAGQEGLPDKILYFYRRLKLGALIWAEGRIKRKIMNSIQRPTTPLHYFLISSRQSINETASVGKIANHLDITRLPEPLDLEFQYTQESIRRFQSELNPEEKTPFLLEEFLSHPSIPKTPERSLYAVRELLRISKERNLKRVHYLCGAAHDSQSRFFLENPDYSFGHLNEYMEETGLLKVRN